MEIQDVMFERYANVVLNFNLNLIDTLSKNLITE